MNKIWTFLIMSSLLFAFVSGRTEEVFKTIIDVPNSALENLLKIAGMMIVYSGLFRIAIDSKIITFISKPFRKLLLKLFRGEEDETIEYISANVIANLLGLGIASTPLAIKALEKMKSKHSLFVLLNVASFTILPLSVLGIRESYNSEINIQFVFWLIGISSITSIFVIIQHLVKR